MLSLRGITLVFHRGEPTESTALDEFDLDVARGQFCTVIGSNGAGKSSLVRIVSGETRPTTGSVTIDGTDVTRKGPHARARLVARVFDNPMVGTVPELSIEENMALALSRSRRRALRRAVTAQRRATMRAALAAVGLGLEDRLSDPVSLLSAGQRQCLTLVMATLTPAKVLLLDEHVAALDPATQRRVLTLTASMAGAEDRATLMVTHNMRHALELGDRLLVLARGRLVSDLDAREKKARTVDDLIAAIVNAGDMPADRTLLADP